MSETSLCRERLARFCVGDGCDIGFGGDKIVPHAICMDLPSPYTKVGESVQHLHGDCRSLPFRNEVLSWVFASHLTEDFTYYEQVKIVKEWVRVLKPHGNLIIYGPDEKIYSAHCRATGQPYNLAHKEPDYSLESFKREVLSRLARPVKIIHENPHVEIYSWEIVMKKL